MLVEKLLAASAGRGQLLDLGVVAPEKKNRRLLLGGHRVGLAFATDVVVGARGRKLGDDLNRLPIPLEADRLAPADPELEPGGHRTAARQLGRRQRPEDRSQRVVELPLDVSSSDGGLVELLL